MKQGDKIHKSKIIDVSEMLWEQHWFIKKKIDLYFSSVIINNEFKKFQFPVYLICYFGPLYCWRYLRECNDLYLNFYFDYWYNIDICFRFRHLTKSLKLFHRHLPSQLVVGILVYDLKWPVRRGRTLPWEHNNLVLSQITK